MLILNYINHILHYSGRCIMKIDFRYGKFKTLKNLLAYQLATSFNLCIIIMHASVLVCVCVWGSVCMFLCMCVCARAL